MLIFKGLTWRRLYKSFGVNGLNMSSFFLTLTEIQYDIFQASGRNNNFIVDLLRHQYSKHSNINNVAYFRSEYFIVQQTKEHANENHRLKKTYKKHKFLFPILFFFTFCADFQRHLLRFQLNYPYLCQHATYFRFEISFTKAIGSLFYLTTIGVLFFHYYTRKVTFCYLQITNPLPY
jgi:hypothetical protein